MHTGGASPFSKKECIIYEWPVCPQEVTVSFLLLQEQETHLWKDMIQLVRILNPL